MPLLINNQRKITVDRIGLSTFADRLLHAIAEVENGDFAIAFISDRRMKQLNSSFRGIDSTTDVLSFPHEPDNFLSEPPAVAGGLTQPIFPNVSESHIQPPVTTPGSDYLGDIVISVEQAKKQAEENGLTFENEIKQLILHGLLHLCGYDHETDNGEMNKRELELRKKLKI